MDEAPDESADCCWLPGGYPELHGGKLAAADAVPAGIETVFRKPVRCMANAAATWRWAPGLVDREGTRHEMAGLLGLVTSYEKRKMHLGYRLASFLHRSHAGPRAGARLRGHEFHYSTILDQPDMALARVVDANGEAVPEPGRAAAMPPAPSFT